MSVAHDFTVFSPTWLCIVYTILLIAGNCVGLLGNILVIAATYNKNETFKLDMGTIILMRHLAIADVITIILYPLPMTVTYATQRWLFGTGLCHVVGHIITIPVMANIHFILLISLQRYARCKFPHKIRKLTAKKSTVMCVCAWIVSCLFIGYNLIRQATSEFDHVLATCTFRYPKSAVNAVIIIVITVVPFLIIVSTNIFLWYHVRTFTRRVMQRKLASNRSRNSGETTQEKTLNPGENAQSELEQRKARRSRTLSRMLSKKFMQSFNSFASTSQGTITTTAVTALFAVTWVPTVFRFCYSAFGGEDKIPPVLEQSRYLFFIGTWGNPVLYAMINKGFRDYFKKFCNRLCRVYVVQPSRQISKRLGRLGSIPSNSNEQREHVSLEFETAAKSSEELNP